MAHLQKFQLTGGVQGRVRTGGVRREDPASRATRSAGTSSKTTAFQAFKSEPSPDVVPGGEGGGRGIKMVDTYTCNSIITYDSSNSLMTACIGDAGNCFVIEFEPN